MTPVERNWFRFTLLTCTIGPLVAVGMVLLARAGAPETALAAGAAAAGVWLAGFIVCGISTLLPWEQDESDDFGRHR